MLEPSSILKKLKNKRGRIPPHLHIKKDCGTYVIIVRGKVIEVGRPKIIFCPLAAAVRGTDLPTTREMIKREVERNIKRYGYFTWRREVRRKNIMVPYGASEMMMAALKKGHLDAAVVVCDGAGSVITPEPSVVQGIGAHMNGLLYTSPLQSVIRRLERTGSAVVFPRDAEINQIQASRIAAEKGYRKIAVTVSGEDLKRLEEIPGIEKKYGCRITVLAVCLTGTPRKIIREIAPLSHLVWGCASRAVREVIGPRALLQLGVKIPVFAVHAKGVKLIAAYSPDRHFLDKMEIPGKKYLVFSRDIYRRGKKSQVGIFPVYLTEVEKLPYLVENEPRPLL